MDKMDLQGNRSSEISSRDSIFAGRPPLKQQSIFFNQFHTYICSGISILSFLPMLKEVISHRPMREAVERIQAKLHRGQSLGKAFKSENLIFTDFQIAMMSTGEDTGNLDKVSLLLAQFAEKGLQVRNRLLGALILPILYLFVALTVPPVYIAFTQGIAAYLVFIVKPILLLLGLALLPGILSRFHVWRIILLWDGLKLGIPFVGSIIGRLSIASFCRVYAIATRAGAGVDTIIRNAVNAISNTAIREKFAQSILTGDTESDLLNRIIALLVPYPMVLSMFKTGTATGNIPEMMDKAADYLEEEAWTKVDAGLKIFPAVVLLIIAVYIAYLVIKFWSGLYSHLPGL